LPIAKTWADLDFNFPAHPNTGHLSIKHNADAVIASVKSLLLTNHYERLFHPEIGCNLTKHLFDPMDIGTTLRIKQTMIDTLNNFEPRVSLTTVDVHAHPEQNGYRVELKFFLVNEEVERRTIFFLERNN
jgi:phage baseplate assembly protein W